MAQGTMKAPLVMYKRFNFSNIPITTRSGGGAYYAPAGSRNVAVDGYTAIGAAVCDWETLAANVVPYIAQSTQTIGFMSDISQTAGAIDIIVTYIKNASD